MQLTYCYIYFQMSSSAEIDLCTYSHCIICTKTKENHCAFIWDSFFISFIFGREPIFKYSEAPLMKHHNSLLNMSEWVSE